MWQGTYHATPYFVSKVLVEIPMAILTSLLIYLTTYWLLGIQGKCRPYPPRTDRGGSDRTNRDYIYNGRGAISHAAVWEVEPQQSYICIVLNPQPDRSMRREHCALRRR
jgi:hypothetical protein